MSTVGGAISGYCATARSFAGTRPANTMMMAMTPANTGLWMKNRDTRLLLPCFVGCHRRALPQAHQVVDDHRVARLQPLEHDPVTAQPIAGADRALHRLTLGRHPDEASALVLHH